MPTGDVAPQESVPRAISYARSDDGTWGTVRVGSLRLTGRTAAAIGLALLWLLLTLPENGSGGWTALWTNVLFVLELFILTSGTRTITARTVVTLFLVGGFMMSLSVLGGHIYTIIQPDRGTPSRDLVIPPMEEVLKIAPVLFLLWRWRRDRSWTLGVTDVLLMAAASGAGFGLVEDAVIRHRFGWGPSIGGLPITEITGLRLIVGHAIWTALAGTTIGFGLLIRRWRALAFVVGLSGLVVSALDHVANNLLEGTSLGVNLDKVLAHGHVVWWLFLGAGLLGLAVDAYIAQVTLPRIDELRPPKLGAAPSAIVDRWRFHLDRRELLYAGFRRRLAPPDRAPPEPVVWSLITSLVDRHFAVSRFTA